MVTEFIVYGVYANTDPERIRYVGLTTKGLTSRIKGHWKTARSSNSHRPLYHWMRKYGDAVRFKVIESLSTQEEVKAAEIRWIAYYRAAGQADLNITNGGESANGYRHSEETRKKISEYLREHPNRHSPEKWHREAVGEANRRRLRTEEGRTAHVQAVAKLTWEQVSEIKFRLWNGEMQGPISRDYGISFQTISNISRGISWDIVPWPIGPRRKPDLPPPRVGSQTRSAKLTEEKVRAIWAEAVPGNYPVVAARYGISIASVSNIVTRKSWKHVD